MLWLSLRAQRSNLVGQCAPGSRLLRRCAPRNDRASMDPYHPDLVSGRDRCLGGRGLDHYTEAVDPVECCDLIAFCQGRIIENRIYKVIYGPSKRHDRLTD